MVLKYDRGPVKHIYQHESTLFNNVKKHLDNIECHFYLFYAQKVLLEGRN